MKIDLSNPETFKLETLVITGYVEEENCEHCGRLLKHGIRLDDGRVVGAACFANQLTKRKVYNGKTLQRPSASTIVKYAKVVQYVDPSKWNTYAVSQESITFPTN